MVANRTTGNSTQYRMVTGYVPRNTTNCGTLQAALGLGHRRES